MEASAASQSNEGGDGSITLAIAHHGQSHSFTFPSAATVSDLSETIAAELSVPPTNQKFLVAPKIGLLKPPFPNPPRPLADLAGKKITLMGSTATEVAALDSHISAAVSRSSRTYNGPIKPATPQRTRDPQRARDDAMYTFHTIRPLTYLPDPGRSQRYLETLANDPGIRAAMRAHKFSVGLLTEMNPAEHTTRESRTLGLNRNAGEVIELRLRTDAYDGYRDYKTIRKTLCHELAHNVWGEHDRNFWDLTKAIEKEVERGDWTRGGNRLSTEEFYNPNDPGYDESVADHGGWTGGEFVLGSSTSGQGASSTAAGESPLSRREILARAAEERSRKAKEHDAGGQAGGSS